MDISKTQQHLEAIEALWGEYQAIQDKRVRNIVQMAVMACVVCLLCGALAGASYWYLYGYPASDRTDVHEVREAGAVEVHSAKILVSQPPFQARLHSIRSGIITLI
jgi:hypothetical protein